MFLRDTEGLACFQKLLDTSLVERTRRRNEDALYFSPLPYSQKPEWEIPDTGNGSLIT